MPGEAARCSQLFISFWICLGWGNSPDSEQQTGDKRNVVGFRSRGGGAFEGFSAVRTFPKLSTPRLSALTPRGSERTFPLESE